MIDAIDVSRQYGTGPQRVTAVKSASFRLAEGERVAIIGKSGSGKSTLLNLLAGLDRPSSGTLSIGARRLDQMSRREMADYRLRTVGMIFQAFQLIPQRTALQNVELPLILGGCPARERRARAAELLHEVGLRDRAGHFPYQLSGGEQQRVAIARALTCRPKLILADEPTGNLDSATAAQVLELLDRLIQQFGTTFVFVTHDEGVARQISQRQFRMSDGSLQETAIPGVTHDNP